MRLRLILALLPALLTALVTALVTACSATSDGGDTAPAVPAAVVAPTGESVTGPVDGFYVGRMELITDPPGSCPSAAVGLIEVGDHLLQLAYSPDAIFVAPVPPDGHVHAQAGGYTLDGTLVDGTLAATVEGNGCRSTLDFGRQGAF